MGTYRQDFAQDVRAMIDQGIDVHAEDICEMLSRGIMDTGKLHEIVVARQHVERKACRISKSLASQ